MFACFLWFSLGFSLWLGFFEYAGLSGSLFEPLGLTVLFSGRQIAHKSI